jgi:hypothetical protein
MLEIMNQLMYSIYLLKNSKLKIINSYQRNHLKKIIRIKKTYKKRRKCGHFFPKIHQKI